MREVVFNTEDKTATKIFLHSDKTHDERRIERYGSRMNVEVKCLTTLQENFINKPEINHYPFPKLLSCKDYTIKLTYCGVTMDHIFKKFIKNINISTEYVNKTIECIINNLTANDILHGDLHPNNICIDDNNLHLIDFDRGAPEYSHHLKYDSNKLLDQRQHLRLLGWDLLFLQNFGIDPDTSTTPIHERQQYIWCNKYHTSEY